jgi:intracellular multiplication protein IcmJ
VPAVDIGLSATHSNWRLFMVRRADCAFQTFQEKVFKRDDYTCQFCGFTAKRYMDVVNRDQNFHHNRIDNLVTSCCFCSQCFFLESVGRDEYGGGALIVLPEMSQIELNALCHVLFDSIVSGSPSATQARNVYRSLKLRSQQTEKILGAGMSHPSLLGQLLVDCGEAHNLVIQEKLKFGIRLLPDLQKFAEPVKTWIQDALGQLEVMSC